MIVDQISYALDGLTGRLGQKPNCPSCGANSSDAVDRKYFHALLRCPQCALLFRYPRESGDEAKGFYQDEYSQPGLTTDLPSPAELERLMESNFAGTPKSFNRFIELMDLLMVRKPAKILDFGANWGYGLLQYSRAGHHVVGYEVSKPRAAYGKNLGFDILTEWEPVEEAGPYDICFSSHVLEHTPDPAEAMRRQLSVLKPGGFLLAVFPNGSADFRAAQYDKFHRLWGKVHPVLPTEEFVCNVLPKDRFFVGAFDDLAKTKLADWDRASPLEGSTSTNELLVVYQA